MIVSLTLCNGIERGFTAKETIWPIKSVAYRGKLFQRIPGDVSFGAPCQDFIVTQFSINFVSLTIARRHALALYLQNSKPQ
jgi:hypothetical protein